MEKRFEVRRISGAMVGYDYIVWDNQNGRPVHNIGHPGEVFYTDDLKLAESTVESLNCGRQGLFDSWQISQS